MPKFTITLKNYRCFTDASPLTVEVDNGFTVLIGPNNSGKSSFLKFFYELRQMFGIISSPQSFLPLACGVIQGMGFQEVYDQLEVHSDSNERPMTVDIKVSLDNNMTSSAPRLETAKVSFQRPNTFAVEFIYSPRNSLAHPLAKDQYSFRGDLIINGQSGGVALDYAEFFSLMRQLSNSIYIGAFRNAINSGGSRYYDLSIGTEFINTWHEWKTGENKAAAFAIERVTEDIRKIFDFERLEINAASRLNTLQVSINGKPYKLRELGSGLSQFILVFGSVAFRKPDYIFIDEPELNLHPSLQVDFLTSLASYAQEGVVLATHSIGLARTVGDRIYSLQRRGDQIRCKPFEQTPDYAEFLGEMSFSSFKELGFDQILLVEGSHDIKTVQQFLRMIDKDHKIVILPLGGDQLAKGNMEAELGELTRITPNVAALVDSEREGEGTLPAKRRQEFEASCKKLGFRVCLTKLRAIENYFTDAAVKSVKGDKYSALKPYQKLEDALLPWGKNENWRIARSMNWEVVRKTDVGEFLSAL